MPPEHLHVKKIALDDKQSGANMLSKTLTDWLLIGCLLSTIGGANKTRQDVAPKG